MEEAGKAVEALLGEDPSIAKEAGGGPLFAAAWYHPFIRRHASFAIEGSSPSKASTAFPASSTRRLLSPFRLAFIARPSLPILVFALGSLLADTCSSTSFHVPSDIHTFLCCSRMCGFGTARRRSPKSMSSLVGYFGGVSGIRLLPAMYLMCSLIIPPRSSPTTM